MTAKSNLVSVSRQRHQGLIVDNKKNELYLIVIIFTNEFIIIKHQNRTGADPNTRPVFSIMLLFLGGSHAEPFSRRLVIEVSCPSYDHYSLS